MLGIWNLDPKFQLRPTKIFLQLMKDMKKTQSFESVFHIFSFLQQHPKVSQSTGNRKKQ